MWWGLLGGYVIPVIRFGLRWCHRTPRRPTVMLRCIGSIEWGLSSLRDSLGLVAWSVWGLSLVVAVMSGRLPTGAVIAPLCGCLLAIGISLESRRHARKLRTAAIEYVLQHAMAHPQSLHDRYFAGFAPWPVAWTAPECTLTLQTLDFRRGGRPRFRWWPVCRAAASTFFYASLVLHAARTAALRQALRTVVDRLMILWGARLADLAHLAIHVEGIEHLHHIDGIALVCSNHASTLDFVVTPLALAFAPLTDREPLHIRYLVAKDHFLENWWYYRALRIGMAVEAAGMIFTDRKGSPPQRYAALKHAAQQMVMAGVDVAIYPQGTRASVRRDAQGRLVEPGYYAIGSRARLARIGGHCKKGAARLALMAAAALAQSGEQRHVTVIPLAVEGAGGIFPKGALRIRSESVVTVRIGMPRVILPPPFVVEDDVVSLHRWIDQRLRDLTRIDQRLRGQFRCDVAAQHDETTWHAIEGTLRAWEADDPLPYLLLDLFYQLSPRAQRHRLGSLIATFRETGTREALLTQYEQLVAASAGSRRARV